MSNFWKRLQQKNFEITNLDHVSFNLKKSIELQEILNEQSLLIVKNNANYCVLKINLVLSENYLIHTTLVNELLSFLQQNYLITILLENYCTNNVEYKKYKQQNFLWFDNEIQKVDECNYKYIDTSCNEKKEVLFTNEALFVDYVSKLQDKSLEKLNDQNVERITTNALRQMFMDISFEQEMSIAQKSQISNLTKLANYANISRLGLIRSNIVKQNKPITKRFISLFELFTTEDLIFINNILDLSEIKIKNLKTVLNAFNILTTAAKKENDNEELNKRIVKKITKILKILQSEKEINNLVNEIITIVELLRSDNSIEHFYLENTNYVNSLLENRNNLVCNLNVKSEFFIKNKLDTTFYETVLEMASLKMDGFINIKKYESELQLLIKILTLFNNCFFILES